MKLLFKMIQLRLQGEGLRHVWLLLRLRRAIAQVDRIDVKTPVYAAIESGQPGCLFATCCKLGVISREKANDLQWGWNFAKYFGCTRQEADIVLFGSGGVARFSEWWMTGADYANAITSLLKRYGYV